MITSASFLRLRSAVPAVLAVALLATAGCSGTSDEPAPGGSASASASQDPSASASQPSASSTAGQSSSAGASSAPSQTKAPATTAVPQRSPGDVQSTVPSRTIPTKEPVKINKPAEPARSLKVQIVGQKAITSKAQGPGEVSGPAVRLSIKISNDTSKTVDVSAVTVNVTDSAGNPASQMSGSPARPFTGSVKSGASATGVYVFNIAKASRGKIRVEVSVSPDLPTTVFVGKAV